MFSFDDCVTRAVKATRAVLGRRYREWHEKHGPPSEKSPLDSLHFLLTEYEEPEPFQQALPYKAAAHEGGVRRETVRLRVAGGREVRIDLALPQNAEATLPAVVISPGLGAHRRATRYLEDHLAGHGYLVVRPTHSGSDWMGAALKTPFGAFTRGELRRRLEEVEAAVWAALNGEFGVEPGEYGVTLMGHSFGALTTGLFCGLRAKGVAQRREFPVTAYVAMSPYGDSFPTRRLRIEPESFCDLWPPTLFISGTRDDLWTLGKGPCTHLEPYLACQAEVKAHLLIGGTRHGHFSELCGWVPKTTRIMVNSTVTAFLDAHVRGNQDALGYLDRELPLVAYQHQSWRL